MEGKPGALAFENSFVPAASLLSMLRSAEMPEEFRWLHRRPQLLAAAAIYETALATSGKYGHPPAQSIQISAENRRCHHHQLAAPNESGGSMRGRLMMSSD
jgi:hypothetical protein